MMKEGKKKRKRRRKKKKKRKNVHYYLLKYNNHPKYVDNTLIDKVKKLGEVLRML